MSNHRENHRRFYRLAYPEGLMPQILIGEQLYEVPEISEGGLRVRCHDDFGYGIGDEVTGEIYFSEGEPISVTGVVLRCDRHDFILAPIAGISFARVVQEQRRVLGQCPATRAD